MEDVYHKCPSDLEYLLSDLDDADSDDEKEDILLDAVRQMSNMTAVNRVWLHYALYALRNVDTDDSDEEVDESDAADDFIDQGLRRKVARDIAYHTRFQYQDDLWHDLRRDLLRTTKYLVNKIIRLQQGHDATLDPIMAAIRGDSSFQGNEHTEWGLSNEDAARDAYMIYANKRHDCSFKRRGLYISSECPLVGCSPDGIITCDDDDDGDDQCPCHNCRGQWLMEIKCPSKSRHDPPRVAALNVGLEEDDYGKIYLPSHHNWYYQVTGQMGIIGIPYCDLVVYTLKGILVIHVDFDEEMYNYIMSKLDWFSRRYLYAALLNDA